MICKLEETRLSYPGFCHAYRTNLAEKRIRYFLAARGEELLGFASLHIEELLHHASPVGELQELIVREEARGTGGGGGFDGGSGSRSTGGGLYPTGSLRQCAPESHPPVL